MADSKSPELLVITQMHFDPIWRRCFDRRFVYRGETFASYADIEGYHIQDNLELAERHPEYRFDIESPIVVRKYLEHHPEDLSRLQVLAKQGRFCIGGTGDNIIDGNMVLGESLVHNFVLGLGWVEQHFGLVPRIAQRNDAFGNPAQLPQILRGCGLRAVTGLSYTPCNKPYWRGLDGSVVLHCQPVYVSPIGDNRKYAPCRSCLGTGCAACDQRGIETFVMGLPRSIDLSAIDQRNLGVVAITSEETRINPGIVEWVRERAGSMQIRFACHDELLDHYTSELARLDDPPASDVHDGELNPNNSGCWVSRIRTKQTCRRQEYALLAAEALCALTTRGAPSPAALHSLRSAWHELLFTMFHDAITATHVDAAFEELEDAWHQIDAHTTAACTAALDPVTKRKTDTLSLVNASAVTAPRVAYVDVAPGETMTIHTADGASVPTFIEEQSDSRQRLGFVASDIPAWGVREYTLQRQSAARDVATPSPAPSTASIENRRFRIDADRHGILVIHDKVLGRDLTRSEPFRPGELVLERDYGSPWATLFAERPRFPLSPMTRLASVERQPGMQRFVFSCRHATGRPQQVLLDFKLSVTLLEGLDRVDFRVRAHWDAHSTRVRVAFPLALAGRAIYGIPYGQIERAEYEPTFGWTGANGDWPAIDWAGVQGEEASVAILNRGLPSYATETDPAGHKTVLLSLLRSPTDPTYLHEPQFYSMPEFMGMRDAGHHDLEFALGAYACPLSESSVVEDATAYNCELIAIAERVVLPEAPELQSECARIGAIKSAEEGAGVVLRIWEYRGRGGRCRLVVPPWCSVVERSNLVERERVPLALSERSVEFSMRPFEIMTLVLGA